MSLYLALLLSEPSEATRDGLSYTEIARILGTSIDDVIRIEKRALRKLRAGMTAIDTTKLARR